MKEVIVPAGQRTRILHLLSDSIPKTVGFSAAPAEGSRLPAGIVEIVRRPWIFGRAEARHPLAAEQAFYKGFADADYSIYVTADAPVRIAFRTRHFEASALLWILVALVAVAAIGAIAVPMLAR